MPAPENTPENLGHRNQELDPWQEFKGREDVLAALMIAWQKARQGDPQCAVLLADSGYGKTRVIHEFYRRVSAEANGGTKGSGYWPDELSSDPTRIDPNPDFEGFTSKGEIPWLWWGMRWGCPLDRNQTQSCGGGVVEWTNHLERHVAGLINRRAAQKVAKEALIGALDAVMDFLPIPNVVGMLDTANDCREWVKEIVEIRKSQTEKFDQKKKVEEKALQAVGFLRAFLDAHEKNAATVPVILVLDDAQWADPISLKVVAQLFARARAENWPLFILVSHWETEWHATGSQKAPELDAPLDQWINFRKVEASIMGRRGAEGSFRLHHLGKLPDHSIGDLLRSKFPGLGNEDREYVVRRCDGNPLALEEFIKVMGSESQWFEMGDISLGIDPDYRDDFHGQTLDSESRADKRFMQIAQSNPGLYEFLKLGASQGVAFYHDLLTDLATELKKGDRQWVEQLIPLAENPHCIVNNLRTELSSSEFRRALYRDGLQKRMKKEWRGYQAALKAVLNRWWEEEKFPDKAAGIRLLELYAGVLEEGESLEDKSRAAFVADRLSESMEDLGNYRSALQWAEHAFNALDGSTEENTIPIRNRYVNCLRLMGRFDEALKLARTTLKQAEAELGSEHPDTLGCINNLAVILKDQRDYTTAEALIRKTIEATERTLGSDHPDALRCISNLAIILSEKGDYSAAEPLYRRVLEVRERTLGPEHPDTVSSIYNLANLLSKKGNYGVAEPLFRRVLEIRERTLGPEHPKTLSSVHNLGFVLSQRGNNSAAEPLYRRVLEVRERILGAKHPDTIGSINNLAILFAEKDDFNSAESLFQRALDATQSILGPEHPDTLKRANSLGLCLSITRGPSVAIDLLKGYCGTSNESDLAVAYNLSCFLCRENRIDEAKEWISKWLIANPQKRQLAVDDPDLAAIRGWIEDNLDPLTIIQRILVTSHRATAAGIGLRVDSPTVFLLDEDHSSDALIDDNIAIAKTLISTVGVRLAGVEGCEGDNISLQDLKSPLPGKCFGGRPRFAVAMLGCPGIEVVGLDSKALCDQVENDCGQNGKPAGVHPNQELRSEHMVKTIIQKLQSRVNAKAAILNAGARHNDDIEKIILGVKRKEIGADLVAFVRVRSKFFPTP